MDETIRKLIFQVIDETISPEEFEQLQDAIEQSAEVREEYLNAVHLIADIIGRAGNLKTRYILTDDI